MVTNHIGCLWAILILTKKRKCNVQPKTQKNMKKNKISQFCYCNSWKVGSNVIESFSLLPTQLQYSWQPPYKGQFNEIFHIQFFQNSNLPGPLTIAKYEPKSRKYLNPLVSGPGRFEWWKHWGENLVRLSSVPLSCLPCSQRQSWGREQSDFHTAPWREISLKFQRNLREISEKFQRNFSI